jgi:hypothetical protein
MVEYGEIEYYIEIPIRVNYSHHPAEPGDRYQPGTSDYITIDFYSYPHEPEIEKMIDERADRIKDACWEDYRGW